jgi:hypothetical protein
MRLFVIGLLLIVGISAEAQTPATQWTLVPELRIGSIDVPEYILTQAGSVAIGSDGSIYVGQSRDRRIRVYDSRGRYVRDVGRQGAGPGEFQSVSAMGWRADTLWVTDFVQSRVNLFSREGRVLDVLTINGPTLPGISTRPTPPAALLADGSIVGVPLMSGNAATDAPFVRMSRTGQLIEQFGRLSTDAGTTVSRAERGRAGSLW